MDRALLDAYNAAYAECEAEYAPEAAAFAAAINPKQRAVALKALFRAMNRAWEKHASACDRAYAAWRATCAA